MRTVTFERYYRKYRWYIRSQANTLSRDDHMLAEDLEQEGMTALWQLDLRTVRKNEDAFIRQLVKYKMIDAVRRFRAKRYQVFVRDALSVGVRTTRTDYEGDVVEHPLFGGAEAAQVNPWEDVDRELEVEQLLAPLSLYDRTLMQLVYSGVELRDVALTLSKQFHRPVGSEAAIRYRRDQILQFWRGERSALPRKQAA